MLILENDYIIEIRSQQGYMAAVSQLFYFQLGF